MNIKTDIQSISYVKTHATDILKSINETHRPLYVTQNGKAKAVIIDPESYENMKNAVSLLKLLSLRDNEFQNKDYSTQEDVFSNIESRFGWK